ncbi:hypothetical protein FBT96_15135 [Rhodobacter capsulatus]|uniref:Uncharacterized protein n=1 Tax=Rhodobacter capsulatus TaxID=1061 RepID=A0A4U1JN24_RHOCA|nr:hypothetical protein [Rhodobacter capsulatus]TKD15802.1 hypothetical protein FBT96_15135 [Rhodobacter capsulatus]
MSDGLITTTSSEGLQALGSAAQRSWELITGTLGDRIDPDHAAIFAEPVSTHGGARIEWYVPPGRPGTPVPLAALSAPEAEAIRARLAAIHDRILALADQISAQTGPQTGPQTALQTSADNYWLAEALRNAIEVPDQDAIWALRQDDGGLRPILVNWGRLRDTTRAARGALSVLAPNRRAAAAATAAMATPALPAPPLAATETVFLAAPPPSETPRPWGHWLVLLGWLVLAALIAAVLWLLIAPCGLRPGLLGFCPAPVAATAPARQAEALRAEIAQLTDRLALSGRQCLNARDRAEAPAAPKTGIADLDRRLQARGAAAGEMTISLVWSGTDDLDLRVSCPSGQVADLRRKPNDCGGLLDVDANFPAPVAIDDPVENIHFNPLVPGHYRVEVKRLNDTPPRGDLPFGVVLRRQGTPEQHLEGAFRGKEKRWSTEFEISR